MGLGKRRRGKAPQSPRFLQLHSLAAAVTMDDLQHQNAHMRRREPGLNKRFYTRTDL